MEVLITEQFRRYTEKMQNIKKLEHAEALAITQLKLKRQNTVRVEILTTQTHSSATMVVESDGDTSPDLNNTLPLFCPQVVEKAAALDAQVNFDNDDEKILIERIKSIKEEK